jgi:hypothetical protein
VYQTHASSIVEGLLLLLILKHRHLLRLLLLLVALVVLVIVVEALEVGLDGLTHLRAHNDDSTT